MDVDPKIVATAVLGKEIEDFLRSDIGKYLISRANRVYTAAVDEFKRVDPTKTAEIIRIQADMWKADAFKAWIVEGIQEGLTALNFLDGRDDDHQED